MYFAHGDDRARLWALSACLSHRGGGALTAHSEPNVVIQGTLEKGSDGF